MSKFHLPDELKYNNGLIEDPSNYLRESGCKSWLFLVGEEFAMMDGGMSYNQVKAATQDCINVVSDPPRELNLDLARQHVKALDSLPRPTLISCRTGPRASAVAYMYSGLKTGANPDDVISEAEKNGAPFVQHEDYKQWVRDSMTTLRSESGLEDSNEDA